MKSPCCHAPIEFDEFNDVNGWYCLGCGQPVNHATLCHPSWYDRHFTRGQAFVLGFAAGLAVMVIAAVICSQLFNP